MLNKRHDNLPGDEKARNLRKIKDMIAGNVGGEVVRKYTIKEWRWI